MDSMSVTVMENIPANSNPFHHDAFRMGTAINDRFVGMYSSSDSNELVLVDVVTGRRIKIKSEVLPDYDDAVCSLCHSQAAHPDTNLCDGCMEITDRNLEL